MTNRKETIRSFLKVSVLPIFGALLLRCIASSVRWLRNDLQTVDPDLPVIGAFWHGRQLMMAPLFSSREKAFPLVMLISSHADGRLIAKAVTWFGIHAVFGSSSQGGKEALLKMLGSIQEGASVAITPDGPRGPLRACKAGVIKLASLTGRPIVPVSYSASAYWQFKSWDQMILPKPFSKGVCMVGTPIYIPKELSDEQFSHYTNIVAHALTDLDEACDSFFQKAETA